MMDLQTIKKTILASALLLASSSALAGFPVAVTDSFTVHPSQGRVTLDVLVNDTGDNIQVSQSNDWTAKGGRSSLVPSGITNPKNFIDYTPPRNFAGKDTFWYVIKDDQGRRNAAKATVTVKPSSSRFPDPQPDFVKVPKNKSIRINVLKNDIIRFATIKEFSGWTSNGGRITRTDNGQLKYTPANGFVGTDVFWYKIREGTLARNPAYGAKVTIQVTENNSAGPYPVAKPDRIAVNAVCFVSTANQFCSGHGLNVLQNDIGNNLKIVLNSAWSQRGGKVEIFPGYGTGPFISPVINYSPKPTGNDTVDNIYYRVEDELGRQSWGTVTIDVTRRTTRR